jgi:hypothetical protein
LILCPVNTITQTSARALTPCVDDVSAQFGYVFKALTPFRNRMVGEMRNRILNALSPVGFTAYIKGSDP